MTCFGGGGGGGVRWGEPQCNDEYVIFPLPGTSSPDLGSAHLTFGIRWLNFKQHLFIIAGCYSAALGNCCVTTHASFDTGTTLEAIVFLIITMWLFHITSYLTTLKKNTQGNVFSSVFRCCDYIAKEKHTLTVAF